MGHTKAMDRKTLAACAALMLPWVALACAGCGRSGDSREIVGDPSEPIVLAELQSITSGTHAKGYEADPEGSSADESTDHGWCEGGRPSSGEIRTVMIPDGDEPADALLGARSG